ncbi:MAG: hypothetical protein WC249_01965 [Patescibacteria group bacterium]|jgi:hypothetical protein
MKEKIDLKILQEELNSRIREFYPYFLGFYLLSLIVAFFSKTWQGFFYWPAFHASFIIFSVLFLLTVKFNFHLRSRFKFDLKLGEKSLSWRKTVLRIFQILISLASDFFLIIGRLFKAASLFIYKKIRFLPGKVKLKILIIGAILIFALLKDIGVLDFIVLFYALISVFFIVESRLAAAVALILLASCPFLLILKKDAQAETAAVYAYYFLVITVFTQIRELKKENRLQK